MFVRASTVLFSIIALAGVVSAAPSALDVRQYCGTGSVQCCNSVQNSDTTFIYELFGYLGLPMPPAGTQVGFTCSPITVGGSGSGSSCTSQSVCCIGDTFNGISTGCSPIVINA